MPDCWPIANLDDALGLSTRWPGETLADARTRKNERHALVGLLRQSVFGRLAGYEDVNDAGAPTPRSGDALDCRRQGGSGPCGFTGSQSGTVRDAMAVFTAEKNLLALADLSGQWIDIVHGRRPPKGIVLDMDSSVSPTHGEQENSAWNGPYACTCYHPLFVFNQIFGDLERCTLRPGNVHSADGWERVCLSRSSCGIRARFCVSTSGADAAFAACREGLRMPRSRAGQVCDPHAFRPTRFFRTGSAYLLKRFRSGRPLRTRSGGTTPISPLRRQAGPSRAG